MALSNVEMFQEVLLLAEVSNVQNVKIKQTSLLEQSPQILWDWRFQGEST